MAGNSQFLTGVDFLQIMINAEAVKYDKYRQEKLEAMGVRFLRFSDNEVKNQLPWVLDQIDYWINNNKWVTKGTLKVTGF